MTEDYWDKLALDARLQIKTAGLYSNWLAIYTDARMSGVLTEAMKKFWKCNCVYLLDLGCGPGKWIKLFAQSFPKSTMIGVDLSKQMLKLARIQSGKKNNIHLTNMNAVRLAISDDRFDLVTTVTVLQHIVDNDSWRAAIREIVRVTKPKCHMIVCDATLSMGRLKVRKFSEYVSAFKAEGAKLIYWEGIDPSYLIKAIGLLQYGRSFNPKSVYYFKNLKRLSSRFSMALTIFASLIDTKLGKTSVGAVAPHKISVFEKGE